MSRDHIPLQITDLSGLATSLRKQLIKNEDRPSHLAFLGMIARAAGFRNYQHLQSQADKARPLSPQISQQLDRAVRVFDGGMKMLYWPATTAVKACAFGRSGLIKAISAA